MEELIIKFLFFLALKNKQTMEEFVLQSKMDEHLTNTKWDIRAALQRFEENGIKIDRRFRRDFIKQTTDW